MTSAAAAGVLHPLIARLEAHGFRALEASEIDAFAAGGHVLLVLIEDPMRVRETLDLAVIAPELARAFPGRFRTGLLLPEAARAAQARFGVRRWPALVVLRDGRYVGAVEGLRNWDQYLDEIGRLLAAEPSRPPTIGIPVRADGASGAGA
ncbi:MAG TPA: hydrogenase [Casimicrobiaceae bacterium]|nr:hydrogenase [Casimicrobiaceae bacterium]